LDNLYDEGVFIFRHSKLKPKDCLNGWLHHLLYSRIVGQAVSTIVLGSDTHMVIDKDVSKSPDLEQLINVFSDGCREPSKLFLDLGFAGLDSVEKGKGLREGAEDKLASLAQRGYEHELLFLLAGCDLSDVFDGEFERLCHTVLEPVWRVYP
jgi:exonuclease V gamma subunit